MHQEREPGKELFVDWMGDTQDSVVNQTTGELYKAHFFVATLGNSGYPYVQAFPDEKLDKWCWLMLIPLNTMVEFPGSLFLITVNVKIYINSYQEW
ncbi:MAG: hypothetical protein ACYCX4_14965 [Bacillota bacterium]